MSDWVLVITYRLLFLAARSILENSPSSCSVLKWELILDLPSLEEGQRFFLQCPMWTHSLTSCCNSLRWSNSSCFGCAFISLVCWANSGLLCLKLGVFSLFALWGFWKAFFLFKCEKCHILPCPNLRKWLNTIANNWSPLRDAFFEAKRKRHPNH